MDWRIDSEQPGRWRPGTIAAVVVAGLLLLAAVTVALFGGERPAPPAAALPVVAGPGPGEPVAPDTAQGREAQPAVGPLLTPPPVSWELVSGVAVPVSATAGPSRVAGPVHSGFERSQTGALIAAAQIVTRAPFTAGDGWRQVVSAQLLPGAGRDEFIRRRASVTTMPPPGTLGQFAGFRIAAATADVAVVQLVTRFAGSAGHLKVVTVTVKWVGGDWRLELQPDGSVSPSVQQIPSLDGFVVWGGV